MCLRCLQSVAPSRSGSKVDSNRLPGGILDDKPPSSPQSQTMMIREAKTPDAETGDDPDGDALARIYNHYIENTVITFEETPVTGAEMRSRIDAVNATKHRWLIAESEQDGSILGYAYAGIWKNRCAYRRSVELTVYLDHTATGNGLGTALYQNLLDDLRDRDFHSIVAGIALPNPASEALHEKMGFCKVAHFKETGWKFDQWIDVGYWQLLI